MGICFSEPTIDEFLNDGLTQGLMQADRVDPAALRKMLYGLASVIDDRRYLMERSSDPLPTQLRGRSPIIQGAALC